MNITKEAASRSDRSLPLRTFRAHNSKEVHNHHSTKTQKAQSKKSHQAIDQQIEHPPDRIPGHWCLHDGRDCDLHREAGRRT